MLDQTSHRPALLPCGHPPVLCVVVDTEEEFDWAAPFSRQSTSVAAIAAQTLAHAHVFDRLGIVPTYVIDWPVATTPAAIGVLKGLLAEGRCDIGTHLHPWVNPPHVEEVTNFNSYTGNLPAALELEKLTRLTHAVQDNFAHTPAVFKAGRYGLGPHTSAALQQLGYQIDASVVPHTSFAASGGPDFAAFGNQAYWFGPAHQPLLELPVSTGFCGFLRGMGSAVYPRLTSPLGQTLHLGGIAARTGALERIRLTPEGNNTAANQRLMRTLVQAGTQVLTLTYHSPSLVPGNTPYVRTAEDLASFLANIADCCDYFQSELGGQCLPISTLHQHLEATLE